MTQRSPARILLAAGLWILILGGIGCVVRYVLFPDLLREWQARLFSDTGSDSAYRIGVRVAADSFSGYALLRAPRLKERLAQEGIRLTVLDDGADYAHRMRALARGDVEMAVFPINSFLQCGAREGTIPATIVYVIDETVGADAMVAHASALPGISALNSPEARIVLTPDSPSEFLARVMLASFHLPRFPASDWMIPAKGAEDALRQLQESDPSSPRAYVLWEPYVAGALSDPKVHVLLDSAKMKGYIVDVLVARRTFLRDEPEVVRTVIEAYARTVYEHRDTMIDLLLADAKAVGSPVDRPTAERLAQGIEWKNTLENYAHFGLIRDASSPVETLDDILLKIGAVLMKTGALQQDPLAGAPHQLLFTRHLEAMRDDAFHPGRDINILDGIPATDGDERIRAPRTVRRLTGHEWESLRTVGELRVDPIRFGRGTARLNIQGERVLATLAAHLDSWPSYYLTVIGVAEGSDAQETAALALATARAEAAVASLQKHGVSPDRIRSVARTATSGGSADRAVLFVVGQLPY